MSTIIGECSICFSHLDCADDNICVLHCGHVFHSPCINQWIADQPTCPQCRLPISRRKSIVKHLYLNLPKDTRSEQENDLLQSQVNEQKNINEQLSALVTNLQKELQESIDDKNVREAKTTKALHELDLGQQKNDQLREEMYLFQSQLKEYKRTNEVLSASVSNLEGNLQQSLDEKNESEIIATRLTDRFNLEQKKNSDLCNRNDLLQSQLNDQKNTNDELSATVNNLQREFQQSIDEKNESAANAAKVLQHLNLKQNKIRDLREENDLLLAQLNEQKSTIEKVSSSVTNLQSDLQQSKDEKNDANAAKVLHELELGHQKNNHLREEIYLLQSQLKEHNSLNEQLSAFVNNLQVKLHESVNEKNVSQANEGRALQQLHLEQHNHRTTKETLCDVRNKNKDLGRRLNKQGHTINDLRDEIDCLESDVDVQKNDSKQWQLAILKVNGQLQNTLDEKWFLQRQVENTKYRLATKYQQDQKRAIDESYNELVCLFVLIAVAIFLYIL